MPEQTCCSTGPSRRANAHPARCGVSGRIGGRRQRPLVRSRKQHPFRTCNLSVDVPDPWVYVQGCSWSSVAVDVPTDVDREGLRWRTLPGGLPVAKHLILGQVLLAQPLAAITDLACWDWLASRRPGAARPTRCSGGNIPLHCWPSLPYLPPEHRVVALGEVDGMPTPIPAQLNASVSPSRRSAGVRGDERPRWFHYCVRPCQDANLLISDKQDAITDDTDTARYCRWPGL